MMEEDKDFECFQKLMEWIQAEKGAGDQPISYQKFKAVSELQKCGK